MKRAWMLVGSAVALMASVPVAPAQSSAGRGPIRQQLTCNEFLRIDDGVKPEIVYWFATRGDQGKGNAVIGVDETDGMVPALVEHCKGTPAASLSQEVKARADKLRGKL